MRSLDSITPVILAAGDSTRMGYPKALLPFGDTTFLNRILSIAGEVALGDPVIVLGRAAGAIKPSIPAGPAILSINPDPGRGQLSSIQIGIESLGARTQACMIWPVDQPCVSADLVRRLAHLFIHSECLIAFPRYEKQRGHPAIFHCSLFREFLEARMEEGPKSILVRHLRDADELLTDERGVVQDIDTPSDYLALMGESLESAVARQHPHQHKA